MHKTKKPFTITGRLKAYSVVTIIIVLLTLSGCSFTGQYRLPSMPLFTPAALQQQWQVNQAIVFYPKTTTAVSRTAITRSLSLLAAWSVRGNQLDLVGLTPTGQTLMALSYNGQQLHEQYSPLLKAPIAGREIIAQLQLAHWPLAVIHEQLQATPWHLETQGTVRQLYYKQRHILDIYPANTKNETLRTTISNTTKSTGNTMIVIHYTKQYRLAITTLQQVAL